MYYLAKVKEEHVDPKTGNPKSNTLNYLVEAVSPTDVEVQITGEYKGSTFEWEITSIAQTKIVKILEADRGDGA